MELDIFTKKQLDMISRSAMFAGLDEQQTAAILQDERCRLETFMKDEVIYDLEAYSRALGYVVKGGVAAHNAMGYLMNRMPQGSYFGVAALFNAENRYVSEIRAEKESQILLIEESLVEQCITRYPVFAMNYIRFLSSRILFLNRRISLITSSSNTGRLLGYLLNAAERQGEQLQLQVSYSQLSRSLNMGRSSLYRALDELQSQGVITREGKKITLLNYGKTEEEEI